MSTDTPQAAKPSAYQQRLEAQAQELYEVMRDELGDAVEMRPHFFRYIHDVLKEVALESFKNGIEAGRRRPQRPDGQSERPAYRSGFRPRPTQPVPGQQAQGGSRARA